MGEVLGQYDYDEEKECYVQKSTEQGITVGSPDIGVRRYLCSKYYQNIKWWIVFHTPNEETETNIELLNFLGFCPDHGVSWDFGKTQCTFLYIKSRELKTGWEYYDGETWHPDPSLTVIPGTLPPVPSQYTVTASHASETWSAYSGVYKKTEQWWAGRPVYVKTEGAEQLFPNQVLFLYQESRWNIGPKLGWYALRESQPGNWTYVSYGPYEFPLSVKMVPGGGEWLLSSLSQKSQSHKSKPKGLGLDNNHSPPPGTILTESGNSYGPYDTYVQFPDWDSRSAYHPSLFPILQLDSWYRYNTLRWGNICSVSSVLT